jgi:hypothetical protein
MRDLEDALRDRGYRRAWVVDTEYCSLGNHPRARCLCALDLLSGERREIWLAGVADPPCPFTMAADELFIFWAADADVGIFIALGWPVPRSVIDTRVEFMRIRCGLPPLPSDDTESDPDIVAEREARAGKKRAKKPGQYALVRVARHYGVPCVSDEEKGEFRDLAMQREDEFSNNERIGLLAYCSGDVDATAGVTRALWSEAELSDPQTFDQALIRGFYMSGAAWVQHLGVPIDVPLYRRLAMNAYDLRASYIADHANRPDPKECVDVYKGGRFNYEKFGEFLKDHGLFDEWPRTPAGQLVTDRKRLERLSIPIIDKFLELRATVDLLEGLQTSFDADGDVEENWDKVKGLRLCRDGRNRAPLFPFGTKTSRNALAGPTFLFTAPAWMRFLLVPPKGRAVAALDWACQELRIAAIRSKDPALSEVCKHEDPYIELMIACGRAPPGATKKTHRIERKIGKIIVLAMLYGAGARMVATNAGISFMEAADLLRSQREAFPIFYAWCDNFAYRGLCAAPLYSVLGWRFWPRYWKDGALPDRTCRNFPVQSTGAEIMRLAAIRAFEAGIATIGVVHDSSVIEAAEADIEQATAKMKEIMNQATIDLLGQSIPIKEEITRSGERYFDDDGEEDFKKLMRMLEAIERERGSGSDVA